MKFKKLLTGISILILSADVSSQNVNVTLRSQLAYPGESLGNICGYVDSLGNEYALVGITSGMSIVNVTDPSNPVKVFHVPGPTYYKEIKVHGKFAYFVCDISGDGLHIVDLSSLPDTTGIVYKTWNGDGAIAGNIQAVHTLHIDKNFVYLYGCNYNSSGYNSLFNGGATVADITDPWNPTYAGNYSKHYIHDGYVRNDTMYAAHINNGFFSVVDFRNKSNPIELATQYTPGKFTHSTWLSSNSKTLFTADENYGSYLTAYDLSDLSNISELDRIQSNPGSGSIAHNTHIIKKSGNDYAVTSWYTDGFTIVDAGRPNNLIQVGNYDTYAGSGSGYNGTWGVYPFLPSGTIVTSNMEGATGLSVFTPNYIRACYLEGIVTDSLCNIPLSHVKIKITSTNVSDSTDIVGQYRTGYYAPGIYTVTFSKTGYVTRTLTGVNLSPGNITNLNVKLYCASTVNLNGTIKTAIGGTAIPNANVQLVGTGNSYNFITDGSGNFNSCAVMPGTYDIICGKWGYKTKCFSQTISSANTVLPLTLDTAIYDDFSFDYGWTVSSTAYRGIWERCVPFGIFGSGGVPLNTGADVLNDCSDKCFVTGNGPKDINDYVTGGHTILTSPEFDLAGHPDAYVSYYRWARITSNDSLLVSLTNGTSTVPIETVVATTPGSSSWLYRSVKVSDYLVPTANMKIIFDAWDYGAEAGVDKFYVFDSIASGINEQKTGIGMLSVYPNPFSDETKIDYEFKSKLTINTFVTITDITGRVVDYVALTQSKGTVTLKPSINAGVYFVKIINGTEVTEPVKVIKMK